MTNLYWLDRFETKDKIYTLMADFYTMNWNMGLWIGCFGLLLTACLDGSTQQAHSAFSNTSMEKPQPLQTQTSHRITRSSTLKGFGIGGGSILSAFLIGKAVHHGYAHWRTNQVNHTDETNPPTDQLPPKDPNIPPSRLLPPTPIVLPDEETFVTTVLNDPLQLISLLHLYEWELGTVFSFRALIEHYSIRKTTSSYFANISFTQKNENQNILQYEKVLNGNNLWTFLSDHMHHALPDQIEEHEIPANYQSIENRNDYTTHARFFFHMPETDSLMVKLIQERFQQLQKEDVTENQKKFYFSERATQIILDQKTFLSFQDAARKLYEDTVEGIFILVLRNLHLAYRNGYLKQAIADVQKKGCINGRFSYLQDTHRYDTFRTRLLQARSLRDMINLTYEEIQRENEEGLDRGYTYAMVRDLVIQRILNNLPDTAQKPTEQEIANAFLAYIMHIHIITKKEEAQSLQNVFAF